MNGRSETRVHVARQQVTTDKSQEDAMNVRRALGLMIVAVAMAAVLVSAATALPAPPVTEPGRLGDWWTRHGTVAAVMSVLRIGGLAFCGYLAAISFLGVVCGLTRWNWAKHLATWTATPALRRMIAGGSLAIAVTSTHAAVAAPPAAYTVTDLGAVESTSAQQALPRRDVRDAVNSPVSVTRFTVTDIGAATNTPEPHSVTRASTRPVTQPPQQPASPVARPVQQAVPPAAQTPPQAASPPRRTPSPAAHTPPQAVSPETQTPQRAASPATGTRRPWQAQLPLYAGAGTTAQSLDISVPSPAAGSPANATSPTGTRHTRPTETSNVATTAPTSDTPAMSTPYATARRNPGTPAASAPSTNLRGDAGTAAETWLVESGDHLWSIAAATVSERGGSDDHLTVARYWVRLIEANIDIVGNNPDLIYPGQLIHLPR